MVEHDDAQGCRGLAEPAWTVTAQACGGGGREDYNREKKEGEGGGVEPEGAPGGRGGAEPAGAGRGRGGGGGGT